MRTKILLVVVLATLFISSCNKNEKNKKSEPNEFKLIGKIKGSITDKIILQYIGKEGYVSDTVAIKNGKFFIKGKIKNSESAILKSNITSMYMEDPNLLHFFLDPNNIKISLIENDFKEAIIIGSKTQTQYDVIKKITAPIYSEIQPLMLERNNLIKKRKKVDNTIIIDNHIETITKEWQNKLQKIQDIELKYARENNESYLSAYFVKFYLKQITKDSLRIYYSKFNQKIKESSTAIEILKEFETNIVNSGDVAPNFVDFDSNGNNISLNQFKGKFVLLDFWASWCVPCLEKHPKLKQIYKKYNSKGLEIIGISLDKNKESWKKYLKSDNGNWHHIYVGLNNLNNEDGILEKYSIQPIPAYILIDRNGYIIDRYLSADIDNIGLDDLEKKLETVFK